MSAKLEKKVTQKAINILQEKYITSICDDLKVERLKLHCDGCKLKKEDLEMAQRKIRQNQVVLCALFHRLDNIGEMFEREDVNIDVIRDEYKQVKAYKKWLSQEDNTH